jgi:hypothetical protein
MISSNEYIDLERNIKKILLELSNLNLVNIFMENDLMFYITKDGTDMVKGLESSFYKELINTSEIVINEINYSVANERLVRGG